MEIGEAEMLERVTSAESFARAVRPPKELSPEGLPKTRSGKIMRRILRKLAENPGIDMGEFGDISTLADPSIVAQLKEGAMKLAGK